MVTAQHVHNPCGGDLSLDFANSIGRSPGVVENERLVDYAALTRWSVQAGSLSERRARVLDREARERTGAARKVLARALALREACFAIFYADVLGQQSPRAALETLNTELARALAQLRVASTADGFGWAWSESEPALDAPLWPIARAAANLLVSPERERVKACANDACLWIFLDRTRNHGRRWCEMKGCGNRAKVREHRRRLRG